MVYVTERDSNRVSVIDGKTNSLVKSIVTDNSHYDISVNPLTNMIYTVNRDSNTVSVIDGDTNSIAVGSVSEDRPTENSTLENGLKIGGNPFDVAVNPNTNMVYVIDKFSKKISFIDGDTDEIIRTIVVVSSNSYHQNIRGNVDLRSAIAVNPNANLLYTISTDSNTVSVIDGSEGSIITNNTVEGSPFDVAFNPNSERIYDNTVSSDRIYALDDNLNDLEADISIGKNSIPYDIAVNPNTNMVYVANRESGTVSIINGHTNKLTAGVKFNVNPSNSGFIECNRQKVLSNYSRYDIGTQLKCEAKANTGFQFSSWSSNFHLNNPRSISTVFDFIYIYWFGALLSNLNNDPNLNNIPLTNFVVSKYGELNANFVEPPVTIPPEVWTPLYGLIPGFFIPSIISWLNGRRQRGYLKQSMHKIGKKDKSTMEKEITELYTNGKISESHNQMLKDKISEYYNNLNKSQGSPVK